MRKSTLLLMAAMALAPACGTKDPTLVTGIDLKGMDRAVAPGDDFDAYTNGGWIKATPIPHDKPAYGIFSMLADNTRQRLRSLFEESAQSGGQIGDYYSSFMDEAGIEQKGLAPLQPQLDSIAAIADRHALARAIGGDLRADVDALNNTNFETPHLFGVWVTQGLTDPTRSYPYLLQGGLGMPDRDYYLSSSEHMAGLRKQYQAHIEAMFRLAGFDDPAARAARVMALETGMARAACHARRIRGRAYSGHVDARRTDGQGAGTRLAGPAQSRRACRRACVHRLASQGHSRPFRAGRIRASGHLEGLAGVPYGRGCRALSSEGIRGGALQFLRQGAQRHSGTAPPLAARHRFHQLRARRRGRQALCRPLFPGRHQGEGPGHGRGSDFRLPPTNRRALPGCRPKPR